MQDNQNSKDQKNEQHKKLARTILWISTTLYLTLLSINMALVGVYAPTDTVLAHDTCPNAFGGQILNLLPPFVSYLLATLQYQQLLMYLKGLDKKIKVGDGGQQPSSGTYQGRSNGRQDTTHQNKVQDSKEEILQQIQSSSGSFSGGGGKKSRQNGRVDGGNDLHEPLLKKDEETVESQQNAEDASQDLTKQYEDVVWSRNTFARLVRFLKPDTPILTVALSAGVVAAYLNAYLTFMIGTIIDEITSRNMAYKKTCLEFVLVATIQSFCVAIRGGLFTYQGGRLEIRMRETLVQNLLKQELAFFDVTKIGDLTSRLSSDIVVVGDSVTFNINIFVRNINQIAVVFYFMYKQSWRLTMVAFLLVPVITLFADIWGSFFEYLGKEKQQKLAETNSVAEEQFSNILTVRVHGAEKSGIEEYHQKLLDYLKIIIQFSSLYSVFMLGLQLIPNGLQILLLGYGGNLVLTGKLSPGQLLAFILYSVTLITSLMEVGDLFGSIMRMAGAAQKVLDLIDRKSKILEQGNVVLGQAHHASTSSSRRNSIQVRRSMQAARNSKGYMNPQGQQEVNPHLLDQDIKGQVALQNIKFRYPSRPQHLILNNLSFEVRPGQTVALVGASGGGKSSIIKLIERLYEPEQGNIMIDGRDIKEYKSSWIKKKIAYVNQEPTLFSRSIYRNIMYGLEEDGDSYGNIPSYDEVIEASKSANAHSFIQSLPEGYDTNCGERGVQMSGGQKQRIAIARALIRKPKILLLDEATSALDAESESLVQEALDRAMEGLTVIIVAHRLSTVHGADNIIVMAKGQLVEQGTHDELMGNNKVYSNLVSKQLQVQSRTSKSQVDITKI